MGGGEAYLTYDDIQVIDGTVVLLAKLVELIEHFQDGLTVWTDLTTPRALAQDLNSTTRCAYTVGFSEEGGPSCGREGSIDLAKDDEIVKVGGEGEGRGDEIETDELTITG